MDARPAFFVALLLAGNALGAGSVAVDVDFAAAGRPVSPLIFGVSYGDPARNAEIGYPLVRWGGNAASRYNWQADVHNTGSDYYFENIVDCGDPGCIGTPPAGNSADAFFGAVLAAGATPLVTIPTIGWVARADSPSQHPFAVGFSTGKYGAQLSTDFWDAAAGNGTCDAKVNKTGFCSGGLIVGNDPADTSVAVQPGFAADWISHLRTTFGTAAAGGIRFYALDNEPMLWNSTHRDVHPQAVGFDEAWSFAQAYATAIREAEPDARITGPVTWGYCDLFGSAKDNCHVGDDRTNHGLPFVAWYLQQVCAHPLAGGTRVIDYLDLHYYPQGAGVTGAGDDATTSARRLAALRELYDPAWVSDSWIADLGDDPTWHYSRPGLIPRVRAWIDSYCPGTRLAISEYDFGGDATASGAVAQAEALGIFARDGVDLAARWVAPAAGSQVEKAFILFLDYDGAGARLQGTAASAASADISRLGAYAFRDPGRRAYVLLTNKDTSSLSAALLFAQPPGTDCMLYQFDATHPVHAVASACPSATAATIGPLPARSASLLVFVDSDGIFRDGFDG